MDLTGASLQLGAGEFLGNESWIPVITTDKHIENKVNEKVEKLKKGNVNGNTYDKYPGKGDITSSITITNLTTNIANSGNANITMNDVIKCAWLRK